MATYTVIHVVISLVAIASGFVVMFGFLARKNSERLTALFLSTTILTSLTGYGFPAQHVTPGHVVGAISLVVLAFAVIAKYVRHEERGWRAAYIINSTVALYLNLFVLVVQLFQKVPLLHSLAPSQSELPFVATQMIVLVVFIVLGTLATIRTSVRPVQTLLV